MEVASEWRHDLARVGRDEPLEERHGSGHLGLREERNQADLREPPIVELDQQLLLFLLGGEVLGELKKKEFNSEIWGEGVCDMWEKRVVWVEKSKTLLQKQNSEIWGKRGVRHVGEMGCLGNQRLCSKKRIKF